MFGLTNGGLATSDDARRIILRDGVRYGHIQDRTNGWPVPDAPRSITIAAGSCMEAGMTSTLAMLQGAATERFREAQDVVYWCRRCADTPQPDAIICLREFYKLL